MTLLGGVGFTWEHDVHLYWRRAISLAALAGSEELWAQRLGELAITKARDFSFVDADTLPALRAEVGAVLDEVAALPDDAVRRDGWWVWNPARSVPSVTLAASGATGGGWRLCTDNGCRTLGERAGPPVTLAPCPSGMTGG